MNTCSSTRAWKKIEILIELVEVWAYLTKGSLTISEYKLPILSVTYQFNSVSWTSRGMHFNPMFHMVSSSDIFCPVCLLFMGFYSCFLCVWQSFPLLFSSSYFRNNSLKYVFYLFYVYVHVMHVQKYSYDSCHDREPLWSRDNIVNKGFQNKVS